MKNTFLIFISILLIFSCKSSNKAIVCKNEVKVNNVKHKFAKPYHYDKISSKKIDIIEKKTKTNKKKIENEEEIEIVASANQNIDLNQNSIKERIKRAKVEEEEPEEVIPPSAKLHTLSLIGFALWITSALIPLLSVLALAGFIINIVSLFMLRNNKGKYYGKGFSSVPISIIAIGSFVFGFIMLLIGALISAGGWGIMIAIIGAAFLLISLLLGGLLYYYFSG